MELDGEPPKVNLEHRQAIVRYLDHDFGTRRIAIAMPGVRTTLPTQDHLDRSGTFAFSAASAAKHARAADRVLDPEVVLLVVCLGSVGPHPVASAESLLEVEDAGSYGPAEAAVWSIGESQWTIQVT